MNGETHSQGGESSAVGNHRGVERPLRAHFTEEDRLFFEQIKEKAVGTPGLVRLRRANPFDKFQLGLRQMLEDLMIQRMNENDKIVSRYMDDKAFEDAAFAVLSKVIYETIPAEGGAVD